MSESKSAKNSINTMGGYYTALPSAPWSAHGKTSQNSIARLANEVIRGRSNLKTPRYPPINEAFAIRDFLGQRSG